MAVTAADFGVRVRIKCCGDWWEPTGPLEYGGGGGRSYAGYLAVEIEIPGHADEPGCVLEGVRIGVTGLVLLDVKENGEAETDIIPGAQSPGKDGFAMDAGFGHGPPAPQMARGIGSQQVLDTCGGIGIE